MSNTTPISLPRASAEVIAKCLQAPLIPPLLLAALVRIAAEHCRPKGPGVSPQVAILCFKNWFRIR
jgi:hypothetical protein